MKIKVAGVTWVVKPSFYHDCYSIEGPENSRGFFPSIDVKKNTKISDVIGVLEREVKEVYRDGIVID